MMGSLKALQEWCRIQCENYNDVEIKDMSTSFRDGLAFCAIIHRYRPDLINFGTLSKENVYENNRLAFEVAETQLGIPALLDPEDMVSMKVPDRLSIITYVSQYYNFFNNKSQVNPPCMKRLSSVDHNEPVQKRTPTPFEDKPVETGSSQPTQTGIAAIAGVRRETLSSTCAACQKHVHLVQRILVDGKLYHRNCFRCSQCHSTLLPGSYKLGGDSGALVCTHHLARHALANQNGRPDLSKRPVAAQSVRTGRSTAPHTLSSEHVKSQTPSPVDRTNNTDMPANESATVTPAKTNTEDSLETAKTMDGNGTAEEVPCSSSPPNPFDESDEEEDKGVKEEDKHTANGDLSSTPVSHHEGAIRPVPAPRRVSEPTPPPRPAPRVRLPRTTDGLTGGEHQKPPTPPKPRERSQSPGSLSSGTHKPKDPPWLALVQSESKKKKAPPPPPAGLATPPNTGSLSSLKGEGSRPSTPPPPSNPFEDDDEENNEPEEEEGSEGDGIPSTVVASHPWYSITRPADSTGTDTTPSGGSSSRSASPGSARSKKRPAPPAPQPLAANQVEHTVHCGHSQANINALSIDSLSSGSDHSSSQPPLSGSASSDQEHAFTKSHSEPSICSPCDSVASPSSAAELHPTPSPHPSPMPSNTSSAPATPQTSRSSATKGAGAPPPRPPTTPSPLASGGAQSHIKRICKENPFNRKASPSPKSKNRPPKGPRPARPPAPGHGFPLIKRKVQSDQFIPVEDIHGEMSQLEKQLDELEQRGVELEKKLRDNPNDEDEEHLLVEWFTLIHEKHLLVRREAELVYTAKQQNLEERQADVEYELRCLLNKPEKDWTEDDKSREQELMAELVTIIEQRNQIINNMDQDRQREEEEDKFMEAVLKKKDFHKEPESHQQRKKSPKFKPIKVLKRLSHKGEPGSSHSPRKEKS
ncbi:MICAL-like protein 1 isoform X2 [Echeneis naucrates]|uniref:MICAL-like protein 1 isoform X2 n=1 Tax=Echeneis naucrates TaxID=173247 RepID=UPI0011141417|nr:MICAL-like protein 1 isoform X2 [Echeneis naucrates]